MSTEVVDDYTLFKYLGKGSFGEVFLTKKKGSNELFATKKINKSTIDDEKSFRHLKDEIQILKFLNHPNIVKLERFIIKGEYYYIIMEYINGGSLRECLNKYKQKYNESFPEDIIQYLMRQIVDAIKFLHNK